MKRRYTFTNSDGQARGFIEFDGPADGGELTIELTEPAATSFDLRRRRLVQGPHGASNGAEPLSIFWLDIMADELARELGRELVITGDPLPDGVDPPPDVLRLAH